MRLSHSLIYYLPTPCKKDTDILLERLSEVAMCATITMHRQHKPFREKGDWMDGEEIASDALRGNDRVRNF
jgi:hypothetical protein